MFERYVELSRAHPLLLAAVQFALLGTLGELLARLLRQRAWPFGAAALLLKTGGWALLGVYVKFMFAIATAGVAALGEHGLLPLAGDGLPAALLLSAVLNVFLGPSLVLLHRLLDNGIARATGGGGGWAGIGGSLATLLWLWIPLHTVTFCAPVELRIGLAALWSLLLGVVLGAFARRAAG